MPKIEIPETLFNNLTLISEALGRDRDEFIKDALYDATLPYMTHDENWNLVVNFKPAVYMSDSSKYARKVAKNEGRKFEGKEIPCLIIEETTMFGNPYYSIIMDGKCLKVPADCIKISE